MSTGARAAVRTLKEHGLDLAFGIPGVQNLEYFDAFSSEGMDVILVSHELSASFMADAAGRVSGKPGVVVVVPGPGLTNIFTGLGEALLDSAPVVALIPGVRANFKETFQLHEIDHEGSAKSLVKCYMKVDKVDEVPFAVASAVNCAMSGEPGPVIVEVPYDELLMNTTVKPEPPLPLEYEEPGDDEIGRAADMILSAEWPAFHVGAGAAGARAELLELAERLDAPVSTTISGRGVIPEDHPLSVGFGFGPAGSELAERVFKNRDLVIAVGAKFSEVGSGGYGLKMPRLIHIDANRAVLGRNFPAELVLCGDARAVLARILERVREKRDRVEVSELRAVIKEGQGARLKSFDKMKPYPQSVNPALLLRELRKRVPRDGILTTDSGAHTFWTIFCYDAFEPNTVLSPIDYSSMGYSIPAGIGASLAAPGRQVVSVVGDGGFLMTGTELATVRRLGLPLKVIVFNDGNLGLIKQTQAKIYQRPLAVDTCCVDFERFAEAFGIDYVFIENDARVGEGLDHAFAKEGPVIVDARVEYREPTRHTVGTAKSLIKRTPPSVIMRMAARKAWRFLTE